MLSKIAGVARLHGVRAMAAEAKAAKAAPAAKAARAAAVSKASQQSSTAPSLTFGEVKFQKESVVDVMAELPAFSFYEMNESEPYPFKECTLDRSILIDPPSPALAAPKLEFSKLENGLKLASIDKQGLTAHLGLFVHAGSRFEDASNFGVSHMTSLMAFKSTAHLSHLRTVKTLEQLGANATTSCTAGREEIAYETKVMREFTPLVVPLLIGNVLFPRLLPWEMKAAHGKVQEALGNCASDPDAMVRSMLHQAAYCNNTLGNSALASERSLSHFTPETVRSFMLDHFAPERMVLVAVNVAHSELCKWAMRSFADYNAIPLKDRTVTKAAYTGGDVRTEGATPFCHVAIGLESPSWGSAEFAPAAVLQAILGEGSTAASGVSQSTTSRLSSQIVRQNPYVESCSAFHQSYSDSGLFGVYSVVDPAHAGEVVKDICNALKGIAHVSKEELAVAKAALKSGAHRQADDAASLVNDIGTQLATSGTYVSADDFVRAIDNVSEADVASAAKKILSSKACVAAFGDTHAVPHYSAIEAALKA